MRSPACGLAYTAARRSAACPTPTRCRGRRARRPSPSTPAAGARPTSRPRPGRRPRARGGSSPACARRARSPSRVSTPRQLMLRTRTTRRSARRRRPCEISVGTGRDAAMIDLRAHPVHRRRLRVRLLRRLRGEAGAAGSARTRARRPRGAPLRTRAGMPAAGCRRSRMRSRRRCSWRWRRSWLAMSSSRSIRSVLAGLVGARDAGEQPRLVLELRPSRRRAAAAAPRGWRRRPPSA